MEDFLSAAGTALGIVGKRAFNNLGGEIADISLIRY